jgi:F-type H+-transporting ATPase subunit gamma
MPSLIDIRRRIRATKSTQQITKAMKMVSSSKLRRAQDRIVRSRPFAEEMLRVFNNLATKADPSTHPLLQDDPHAGRTLLVVVTADRGLCGSFNTNVIKNTAQFILEQPSAPAQGAAAGTSAGVPGGGVGREVALALVGRKGRDFFMRRGFDVRYEEVGLFQNLKWAHARAIAKTCIDEFLGPDVSLVYLIYNQFKSVMSQRVVVERLLPIPRLSPESAAQGPAVDYLFEPAPEYLLDILLPYHVSVQVARALLESAAAEHAARMTAMDSATRNAMDMVNRMTLYMNKVRQAGITREIIEVVSGAQSV